MKQNIIVKISDIPLVPGSPNTGYSNWLDDWPVAILGIAILLFTTVVLVLLIDSWRRRRPVSKKKLSGILAAVLLPTLAVLTTILPTSQATTGLALSHDRLTIDLVRDSTTGSITKTLVFDTTISTTGQGGHDLNAQLDQPAPGNIAVQLDDKALTPSPIVVDASDSNAGVVKRSHHLSITVPAELAAGVYAFDIVYGLMTNSVTTLQDFKSVDCQKLAVMDVVKLLDKRNNQAYRVKKLPDNKCWMIDNLKLADVTLTTADTALLDDAADFKLPAAVDDNQLGQQLALDPSGVDYCTKNGNGINVYDQAPDSTTGCGYLYDLVTATTSTNSSEVYSKAVNLGGGNHVPGSICPIGWRLPTTMDAQGSLKNGDFQILNASMAAGQYTFPGSTDWSLDANWLPESTWQGALSGIYNRDSGFKYQAQYGYYWSSNFLLLISYYTTWQVSEGKARMDYSYSDTAMAVRCVLN
jgi:uncharacterized protein (TIGR02145 family)